MTDIRGMTAEGFEELSDVFAANFDDHGDIGAGFALYVDGEPVVDLTGGVADSSGRPYDETTLQLVFSATKGATAMCAHRLIERGEPDPYALVAQYWPEFAAHGKGDVPVNWLLCHKSGLIDTTARLTIDEALDWDTVTAALADSVPAWEPGTQHGYHAVTYGWLVGEVVRRVSAMSLGTFFGREFAEPLALDFWIGLPDAQQSRVAPLIPMGGGTHVPMMMAEEGGGSDDAPRGLLEMLLGPDNMAGRALAAPGGAMADEGVWNEPSQGFMLHSDMSPFVGGRSFGHYGAGGSVGFADPDRRIAGGYVMNKMHFGLAGDPRTAALLGCVDRLVR